MCFRIDRCRRCGQASSGIGGRCQGLRGSGPGNNLFGDKLRRYQQMGSHQAGNFRLSRIKCSCQIQSARKRSGGSRSRVLRTIQPTGISAAFRRSGFRRIEFDLFIRFRSDPFRPYTAQSTVNELLFSHIGCRYIIAAIIFNHIRIYFMIRIFPIRGRIQIHLPVDCVEGIPHIRQTYPARIG